MKTTHENSAEDHHVNRAFATSKDGTDASSRGEQRTLKRLTLDIPPELHRAIKINAVEEGVTMAEKLRALLMEVYGLAKKVEPGSGSK